MEIETIKPRKPAPKLDRMGSVGHLTNSTDLLHSDDVYREIRHKIDETPTDVVHEPNNVKTEEGLERSDSKKVHF